MLKRNQWWRLVVVVAGFGVAKVIARRGYPTSRWAWMGVLMLFALMIVALHADFKD